MERSGNDFSKILFEYFSTVDEVTGDSIEEDNQIIQNLDIKNDIYDCPHCGQVFSNFAEVEGHITTEHEDITRQIVRCSECKKVLPNDEKVIKHHMIDEHIKAKQQIIALGGAPKNMKGKEIDEFEIELAKNEIEMKKLKPNRIKRDAKKIAEIVMPTEIEMKKIKSNLIRRDEKKRTEIVVPKQIPIVSQSEPIMNIENNPELANYRKDDPDGKRYICAYCGDRFPTTADRAGHEKENHVDKDGNSLEIACDLCQKKLPTPEHYRRHCIDKHKKWNHSLVKWKEPSFCCDECGMTFKVS